MGSSSRVIVGFVGPGAFSAGVHDNMNRRESHFWQCRTRKARDRLECRLIVHVCRDEKYDGTLIMLEMVLRHQGPKVAASGSRF